MVDRRSARRVRVGRLLSALMAAAEAQIELCIKDVRGDVGLDPVLRVDLTVHAHGFADGAVAMLLVDGSVQADSGATVSLGRAEPIVEQISWDPPTGRTLPPRSLSVRWPLSPIAVERLEQHRQGGGCRISLNVSYALIAPGREAPTWAEPHRTLRSAWVDSFYIDGHTWTSSVLQPWRQASTISVAIALPAAATAEQRAVVSRLIDAQRKLDRGEYRASVEDSRSACELLRDMHREVISRARDRDLEEREANVVLKLHELLQAVYDYGSAAPHTEPHLRDIEWTRQHAKLGLAIATALAEHTT